MDFWGDYHTHTVYSHGKGSIKDSVEAAERIGLRELGIADHGFNHIFFGVKRSEIKKMRSEIDYLKGEHPNVKVYLSVEANVISANGDIDVKPEDKPYLDIVVCGYHKMVRSSVKAAFTYFACNNLGIKSKKAIVRNTEAYVKAVEKNSIDILSHPGNFCPCDIKEVARACKHFKTYFELNGKRILVPNEQLAAAAEEGCEFILSSDAHSPDRIADFSGALLRAKSVGIPLESIANYKKAPLFKSSGGER